MKILFLLCLCSIGVSGLNAQTDTLSALPVEGYHLRPTHLKLEFGLGLGLPTGHFKSEIDKGLIGGKSFGLMCHIGKSAVDVGFRATDFSYDHVRRRYDSDNYTQITKNKIWVWSGVFRNEIKMKHPFSFYFEGSVGLRRFYTKTYSKRNECFILRLGNENTDNRFDRKKLHSDWGVAYGGAIGIIFRLRKALYSSLYFQLGINQSNRGDFYARNGRTLVDTVPLNNYNRHNGALSMLFLEFGASGIIHDVQFRKKKPD